ncbi:hypothetical protein QFC22_002634 [Naganishia vaughanmartiniae]|uniref:Uncharacterized protein n=1 Tax=Naganishia vaughanmartiniae TaxID=1424756 RepID=A0ACC2XA65_9TREE|nr:hypothetical protein QFC22_002634 [Naganishia vaughanmartiniae]
MRPTTNQAGAQRKRLSFSYPSRNGLFAATTPSTASAINLPPGHFLALPPTHAAPSPPSASSSTHADVPTSAQTVTPYLAASNLAPNTSTTASADFEVDVRTGFLPFDAAVDKLPVEYAVWEEALWAARGEGVVGQGLGLGVDGFKEQVWRKGIDEMPVLSIQSLLSSLPELRRAHVVLTYLLHFYVHSHPTLATPRTTPLPIPASISVPLLAVCPLLGLPPILTYADTVLYNSHPVHPHAAPSFERNPYVKSLVSFTNTPDEAHFYLASTRCELAGVNALSIMRASLDEAFMADSLSLTRLTGYLNDLAAIIDHVGDLILDVRNGCDPAVFYHLIRPWFKGGDSDGPLSAGWAFLGVQEETASGLSSAAEHGSQPSTSQQTTAGEQQQPLKGRKFSGPSAGQSSLIHALDVFLTVDHTPKQQSGTTAEESFMTRMLMYMPAPHRAFLQHLATVPHPIRSLVTVNAAKRPALVAAYDNALEALKRLREKHMRIATLYVIQQARKPPTDELIKMGAIPPPAAETQVLGDGQKHVVLQPTSLSEIIRDEEQVLRRQREEQEEGDEEVRGTGGTALIKFLKMCRDNTANAKLVGQ